jgi:hypothetical protein
MFFDLWVGCGVVGRLLCLFGLCLVFAGVLGFLPAARARGGKEQTKYIIWPEPEVCHTTALDYLPVVVLAEFCTIFPSRP